MASNSIGAFHDINKFPRGYGIIVFPISISRTDHKNGQTPEECFEYIKHFSPGKISEPKVGLNMVYGDFLYLNSKESAILLKEKLTSGILKHKNAFQKILRKNWNRFQIQHAFSFNNWNQLYLNYRGDFQSSLKKIISLYRTDKKFKRYVQDDAQYYGRPLTREQETFFLEEHLMFYLVSKKQVFLPNEYVQGRESWVLWCYPGIPLKAQAYLYQINPLKLSVPENRYENCFYDLYARKLVDFTAIDLENYHYTYEK